MRYSPLLMFALLLIGCDEPASINDSISNYSRPLASVAAVRPNKQILFGDLHVHSSYSLDAYEKGLSFLGGEGLHPPADACDFARFCSQLDFWSINDHAEFLSSENWQRTKDDIRQCNAIGLRAEQSLVDDHREQDMVSFLGWEWTQIGATAETHYGHKNILLRDLEDDKIPARPIHSQASRPKFQVELDAAAMLSERISRLGYDPDNFREHWDYLRTLLSSFARPACDRAIDTLQLPSDCSESAATPKELFERLARWRSDYIAIPHGNSWGLYTPPGGSWHKQLINGHRNSEQQSLIEVFSGHGNSEPYRPWRATELVDGSSQCPAPVPGFKACCWRAGELVQQRCDDPSGTQCLADIDQARQNYLDAGASGHLTLAGTREDDWADCNQCRDCFLPAFSLRPGTSAQAALATSGFDDSGQRRNFRFGFIASSDNHSARPGTGYKQYSRTEMTDVQGHTERWGQLQAQRGKADLEAFALRRPTDVATDSDNLLERQRVSSFYYTGGLVALHSERNSRDAIWQALKRREVYATSGPRLLLWFDLLLPDDSSQPMGSSRRQQSSPRFRVRAVGSFRQRAGCPDFAAKALGSERLQRLCQNECYHPGPDRLAIERIEVIKIRPQRYPDEPLQSLIEDPWRIIDCPANGEGCSAEFDDPAYSEQGRDAVYYVRAIQTASATINARNLRCRRDSKGGCIEPQPCRGDYRSNSRDDCLAPAEHRAWSSPIFIDFAATETKAAGHNALAK